MKELQLLEAKKIIRSIPTMVACSVSTGGSTYRFRVSIRTTDFQFLYGSSATAPKSQFYGEVVSGVAININSNTGVRVSLQTSKVVACNVSTREVDAVEQKVPQLHMRAVCVEYDDGSRYLMIEPLHDRFVRTTQQKARANPNWQPAKAIYQAFGAAGTDLLEHVKKVVVEDAPTVAPPPVTVTVHPIVPAAVAEKLPTISAKSLNTSDLRAVIELLNEQVASLRDNGVNIALRVEEGIIKASVTVSINEEI